MTQADILAKNEETFTNINLIKDLANTYDLAVAGGIKNPTYVKTGDEETPSTPLDSPTTSQQAEARLPKPYNFGDNNEFSPYELTEQSPIRPSKYFADDR